MKRQWIRKPALTAAELIDILDNVPSSTPIYVKDRDTGWTLRLVGTRPPTDDYPFLLLDPEEYMEALHGIEE